MSKVLLQRDVARQSVTIADSAATSGAVATMGYSIFGAIFPSTLDGTAVTFTVSIDGTNFFALYDNSGNTQVSMTVAASRACDLPTALASWPYFKFVIGTSQTGATVIDVAKKG